MTLKFGRYEMLFGNIKGWIGELKVRVINVKGYRCIGKLCIK